MTCVAFSIKFAKTNQKVAENSEFCEKIHYYCELFTSLLGQRAWHRVGQRVVGIENCRIQLFLDFCSPSIEPCEYRGYDPASVLQAEASGIRSAGSGPSGRDPPHGSPWQL